MKEKEKDLEKAEERGNVLIKDKKGEACSVVKETLKGLNQSWAHLDHMVSFANLLSQISDDILSLCLNQFVIRCCCQISQMKVSLRSVLEQWTLYRRAAEEINGYLMEGRYSVSRLHLANGSREAVQQQVENLEVSISRFEKLYSSEKRYFAYFTCKRYFVRVCKFKFLCPLEPAGGDG